MKKSLFLGFTLTLLLLLLLPSAAFAEPYVYDSGTCGAEDSNVTWTLLADTEQWDSYELVISGSGDMKDYPNGGKPWMSYNYYIYKITVESGVTGIGENAFSGCSAVTSVSLPEGLLRIGGGAFQNCGLSTVTIPASVNEIGESAFLNCANLGELQLVDGNTSYVLTDGCLYSADGKTLLCCPAARSGSVSIPSGVTRIGSGAFFGCRGLTAVTIPEGVEEIGSNAFGGCSALTSLEIPASVSSIGVYAFVSCTSLEAVTVASGKSAYVALDGVLYDAEMTTLLCCPGGKMGSVSVPEGVTTLAASAFGAASPFGIGCAKLTAITLPSTLESVGDLAFAGCSGLSAIELPAGVSAAGMYLFANCTSLTSVTLPQELSGALSGVFYGCTSLTSITIPAGVTSLENGVFSNCTGLETITFTGDMPDINPYAGVFYNVNATVYYPAGNETYTEDKLLAYSSTLDWTPVTMLPEPDCVLPAGLKAIGKEAFFGCAFRYVCLPDGAESIGQYAFAESGSLAYIYIPESVTAIDPDAFDRVEGLTIIGVTGSEAEVFASTKGFTFLPTPAPTPVPTPVHQHNWEPVYETVHHDAVTEDVWVVDQASWDEQTQVPMARCVCGALFGSYAGWQAHASSFDPDTWATSHYSVSEVWVPGETIHHDEVGHYETRTVTAAYDEQVLTGYKCNCGATRDP